jgi:hypothetical protein
VHRHTLAILNERNLAAIDLETRSEVSTEVDTRTDRCVSPSVDSIARSCTPVPASSTNTSAPISRDSHGATVAAGAGPDGPTVFDAREADKIFWAQHAHKERITIADKNLLISNKHILRIGEERGLPPIRPARQEEVPVGRSAPTSPLPPSATTPTQQAFASSVVTPQHGQPSEPGLQGIPTVTPGQPTEATSTWI